MRNILFGLLVLCGPAFAQQASPPSRDGLATMRLIDGGREEGGTLIALVEVSLEKSAKTYWRSVGDSGIAPEFDFSASHNLTKAEVLYPAPKRFADGDGASIGYTRQVVFPVRVFSSGPVRLHLTLNYAICETLCMPAKGEASLDLQGGALTQAAKVALANVPVKSMVRPEVQRNGDMLTIKLPLSQQDSDLFAEGPTPDWALPFPHLTSREDGHALYQLKLDGAPKGAEWSGTKLTLTQTDKQSGTQFNVIVP